MKVSITTKSKKYDQYLSSSLFSKYVYKFYKSKNVTVRSKGLLEEFNIKNLKDLNIFLKSNKSTRDLKGYGTKSIYDLKILYEFLLKCLLFDKDEVESYDLVISNLNNIIESDNEKFIDEDLFNTYVHQFFNNHNITIRSKKVIEDLNIKNLKDLGNILKNNEKIYKIRGCGTKTITDLENLYLFILKKESELKIDNVNNERVLFYSILKNSFIDDESLVLSSQKKLNIFNFTLKYFDDIFSDLSKFLTIALKDNIGLKLLDSERNKINKLTTQRLRQLNKRLFETKFSSSKEKILKVLNFSDQNIIFDKPFILFKEEISKYKNDEYFNYRFILFIYFIVNDAYDFINLNFYDKTYMLFDINEIVFYKKIYKFESIYNTLVVSIDNISSKKYYTELKIFENINSEKFNEVINNFINYLLIKNNVNHLISYDNGVIKNNKNFDNETVIEMAIKYYNELCSVDMILIYVREKYPDIKIDKEKIRLTIFKNKDKFFNLGKTGMYGLSNEKYSQNSNENLQGFKSMRYLITNLLKSENKPLHLHSISKNLYKKYSTLNLNSLERIITMTDDFLNIGQSFFILSESNLKFEQPINHRTIVSHLLKLEDKYTISTNWYKTDIVYNFFKKSKVPDYQIEHILSTMFFILNNKVIKSFEKYIIDDIIEIIEDSNIEKVLKNIYCKSSSSVRGY